MITKMNKLALAMGTLLMAGGAMAVESLGAAMASTASVAPECAVAAATPIAFDKLVMLAVTASPTADASTVTGTFTAICTNGTSTPLFTYVSTNASGPGASFRLKGTDETVIDYALYAGASTTAAPITESTAIAHSAFLPNGTSQILSFTANIAAAAKAGKKVQTYSDTITITASWTV